MSAPTTQDKEQGNAHFKAGRYDAALLAYERAVAHDPTNPHLWLNNAAALLKLERSEEAVWCVHRMHSSLTFLRHSNRALVLTSGKNAKAWFRRGTAFQKLGYVSCALSDATYARAKQLPSLNITKKGCRCTRAS